MDLEGYRKVLKKAERDDGRGKEGDVAEAIKGPLLDTLVHSLIVLLIFAIGRFSWWIGFGLFLIFAIHILSRLVGIGFLLLLEGLIVDIVARFVRYRGLNPSRFDEMLHSAKNLLWVNLLLGSVEVYLLVITILLGVSFFW